jgi:hypothetical protein
VNCDSLRGRRNRFSFSTANRPAVQLEQWVGRGCNYAVKVGGTWRWILTFIQCRIFYIILFIWFEFRSRKPRLRS